MQCKTPGDVLRKLRIDRGLTQQAVADALNVNRSTYSFHESGKTQPDLQRVMALSSRGISSTTMSTPFSFVRMRHWFWISS